ncbi:MAG: AMP-binding protein, partial [Verrucomicrobiota bacterium]
SELAEETYNLTSTREVYRPQQRIRLGQRNRPDSPLYNMAFLYTIGAEFDSDRLARAFLTVLSLHDILRTTFAFKPNETVRQTLEPGTWQLQDIDVATDEEAATWAQAAAARPFTPGDWLIDAAIIRRADQTAQLYINMHHLITDAWSTPLFLKQIETAYRNGSGEPAPSYYERARDDVTRPMTAPTSDPLSFYGVRPTPSGAASFRLKKSLDAEQMEGLNHLAQHEAFLGFTPEQSHFNIFAASLFGWLNRTTGETRLRVDCPVHNRHTPSDKQALGLFMDIGPLELELEPDDGFTTLSLKVREGLRDLIKPETNDSTMSSAILNFVPFPIDGFLGQPVSVDWVHPGASDPEHLVRLQVHDFGASGRYHLLFDFNSGAFSEADGTRAVEHFMHLFNLMLKAPETAVEAAGILTDDEKLLLAQWGEGSQDNAPDKTVVEQFFDQARSSGDRIALIDDHGAWTFEDLARAVREHTGRFQPGERIGVLFDRQPEAVVSVLAVLNAGASFVPLDPHHPPDRLATIVEDAGVTAIITDRPVSLPVPRQDYADKPTAREREHRPSLSDEAYVLYTSGSTGKPKGIPITHEGLSAYTGWARREYMGEEALDFPWFTSLSFDLTLTSFFLPLIAGAGLRLYPRGEGEVDSAMFGPHCPGTMQ